MSKEDGKYKVGYGANSNNFFEEIVYPYIKEQGKWSNTEFYNLEKEKSNLNGLLRQVMYNLDNEYGIDGFLLTGSFLCPLSIRVSYLSGRTKNCFGIRAIRDDASGKNTELRKKINHNDGLTSQITVHAYLDKNKKVINVGIINTRLLINYCKKYKLSDPSRIQLKTSQYQDNNKYLEVYWHKLKEEYPNAMIIIGKQLDKP